MQVAHAEVCEESKYADDGVGADYVDVMLNDVAVVLDCALY